MHVFFRQYEKKKHTHNNNNNAQRRRFGRNGNLCQSPTPPPPESLLCVCLWWVAWEWRVSVFPAWVRLTERRMVARGFIGVIFITDHGYFFHALNVSRWIKCITYGEHYTYDFLLHLIHDFIPVITLIIASYFPMTATFPPHIFFFLQLTHIYGT